MLVVEGFLKSAQIVSTGQAFDGLDLGPVGLDGQHQAAPGRQPVNHHCASPAHAIRTADMGACEAEMIAEYIDEQGARLDKELNQCSVDRQLQGGHDVTIDARALAISSARATTTPNRCWRCAAVACRSA